MRTGGVRSSVEDARLGHVFTDARAYDQSAILSGVSGDAIKRGAKSLDELDRLGLVFKAGRIGGGALDEQFRTRDHEAVDALFQKPIFYRGDELVLS